MITAKSFMFKRFNAKFCVSFILLMLSQFAMAQKFQSGLQLGVSATQIDGDQRSGYDKPGLIGGAFVNRYFSENKALEFQINYIEKGSRHNPDPENGDYTSLRIRLNYLEVPLLFKYRQKKFVYEAGFSYGFLLHSFIENETGTVAFKNAPNKTETTVNIGLSYALSKRFEINWRFSYSVFPVVYYSKPLIYDNLSFYNNVLQFNLRYCFAKKAEN